jgi:hypothetical protein
MSENLIDLYYNFATSDTPKFAGAVIEESKPDQCQFLEISTNEKFSMQVITDNFGNAKFWEKIEKTLKDE